MGTGTPLLMRMGVPPIQGPSWPILPLQNVVLTDTRSVTEAPLFVSHAAPSHHGYMYPALTYDYVVPRKVTLRQEAWGDPWDRRSHQQRERRVQRRAARLEREYRRLQKIAVTHALMIAARRVHNQ